MQMKTYKVQTEKPCLSIFHDMDSESPRKWGCLGYFITQDKHYNSPDTNEEIQSIIRRTGDIAESVEDHMALIKKDIEEELEEKVLAIYPVVKYEHSSVSYRLGRQVGFDYSNNGFYIITEKTHKDYGQEQKDFEKIIKNELDTYTKWANGEIYYFVLYDENGEHVDSCGGFFDLDDIKDHLPDEYKDEDLHEYLKYN